jgi:lysyl-tRNA synthetase class 2
MWWKPEEFSKKQPYLAGRQAVTRAIRGFFDDQAFAEVDTPILQICPVIDAHIRAFATDQRGVDGAVYRTMYLHTSPEFAMKKLMVAGVEKLYQICHVFRNGEESVRHSPEFTMIEWYRAHTDYTAMMADCEGLLRTCARACGITHMRFRDFTCDPFADFERLSVQEAFERYADIDLQAYLDDKDAFRAEIIAKTGLHTADDDNWDDLFFRVMGEKIEPVLGMGRPTFLCDYPIAMASLSKPKAADPRFAERFELYVCGIELANAFSELTDAAEQRRRYHVEMEIKERLYGERYPLDEEFIAALEQGMPPSSGIALGVDRLVMLCTHATDINDVLWCGRP